MFVRGGRAATTKDAVSVSGKAQIQLVRRRRHTRDRENAEQTETRKRKIQTDEKKRTNEQSLPRVAVRAPSLD